MSENRGVSRRGLLKAGLGAIAGAGLVAAPKPAPAQSIESTKGTIGQGALPFLIADSLANFTLAPQAQYAGCSIRMAQVPDLSRGVSWALNLTSSGPYFGARVDWHPVTPFRVGEGETIEFWAYLESPIVWPNGDPVSGAQ